VATASGRRSNDNDPFVYASLTLPGVVSNRASRYLVARLAPATDRWELRLRVRAEEASVIEGYVVSGIVALLVTIYLFVALLFPERF
jgi:K+-transporting ATPase KdpF subunit